MGVALGFTGPEATLAQESAHALASLMHMALAWARSSPSCGARRDREDEYGDDAEPAGVAEEAGGCLTASMARIRVMSPLQLRGSIQGRQLCKTSAVVDEFLQDCGEWPCSV